MNRLKLNSNVTVICAIVAMVLGQLVSTSVAGTAPARAFGNANLSAEGRSLDAFVDDLVDYHKKCARLGKKLSLTKAELDSLQRESDDLKRRISSVQDALRQIIDKLKAAGQWDNLDQRLLGQVSSSRFQDFVRRDGFKKTLEETASTLSGDADQISNPLDTLRRKVQAHNPVVDSALRSSVARVGYSPAAVSFKLELRCRLASLRQGISGFIFGKPTSAADTAFLCACAPDPGGPDCTR